MPRSNRQEASAFRDQQDSVRVVHDLPESPTIGETFSFERISRDNVTSLSHGLHKYPAKFIPQVADWGLRFEKGANREVVLDPFCGSGTTLLECGVRGNHGIGVDISPLAVLIAKAKTSKIDLRGGIPSAVLELIVNESQGSSAALVKQLRKAEGTEVLGLHRTWSNWFTPDAAAEIIAIRDSIVAQAPDEVLQRFLLACLSSVVKKCSYLDENQIKVRFVKDKVLAEPSTAFVDAATKRLERQLRVTEELKRASASFDLHLASSTRLPIDDSSVDRVITSPPYINAIDYTMTHKYNMFLLGLLEPGDFKDHCRDYIGVTERAVRAADLVEKPNSQHSSVQNEIDAIWSLDTPVAKNRTFVVNQYFDGMDKTFGELSRVVRKGGLIIMVLGETNRICGRAVQTARICEDLANSHGLETYRHFVHQIANRSSMRLNRSKTGGSIKNEIVYVFRRA